MPPKDTRRRASDADEIITERLRSGSPPNDPVLEADMKTATGLSRVVDFRIPLIWLLGAVGSFAIFQVMLWSSVQEMTKAMVKVEAKLEASNAQYVQTILDVSDLKGRMGRAEEIHRDLQQKVAQQQYQQRPPR